mmetsp:Transcript_16972/g.45736  ORF Transcript_16972/g.45736 Transcript_16972/m.45736 type:complete len:985 (-) Transcript_16972:289-3243(-)
MQDAVIKQCLEMSLSADRAAGKQAEEQLRLAEGQPGFSLILLSIVGDAAVSPGLRQAAAVFFKNQVKNRWDEGEEKPLSAEDKLKIKEGLLRLMVAVPPLVQRQLSEALAIVCAHDFPEKWPTLLPELVQQLGAATQARDWALDLGLLQTCNSIFMSYRHEFKSDALLTKLKYVLELLAAPLLQLAQALAAALEGSAADAAAAGKLLSCLEASTQVHLSLCSQDLPEFFEDHMREWMACFQALLQYQHPALAGDADDPPGPVELLHAAIVETLALYISKYEEEFQPFLPAFVQLVWQRLIATGAGPRYDPLATTSIKFLTSIATSVHYTLFSQGNALSDVCERIVLPNMKLVEGDEEMFEDDPTEYIRRDIEGSDADTRRRVCAELVRGLCRNYAAEVSAIFGRYVTSMLAEHAANPGANWKAKDVAIYLVTALSIRAGNTGALGATQTSGLVDIPDFFRTAILPELEGGAAKPDELPVLKADAIKFVATFRTQLDVDAYRRVLPLMPALLGAKSVVVHTYAAHALERVLTVKSGQPAAPGQSAPPKLPMADLAPHVQPLMASLFGVLKKPGSSENDYAMKAILRVATSAGGAQLAPLVGEVLSELKAILARVCANPSQPAFNHYLFEVVAALVRDTCAANAAAVDAFEAALFPPFQTVLQMDVAEFTPYVFQIFAQLLEARRGSLSGAYQELFSPLLVPAMWERRANVPALSRLLRAYASTRDAAVLHSLPQMLGIFQKLVASKATEGEGCALLAALFEAAPTGALAQYVPEIARIALTRWQHNRTRKYALALCHALGVLVCCHEGGGALLISSMDGLHPGTFGGFFPAVWLDHCGAQGGDAERHVCALALARLALDTPAFLQQEGLRALWPRTIEAAVGLLEREAVGGAGEEDGADDMPEEAGYSAAYARLHHAAEKSSTPCADVDVRAALATGLQRLSAAQPGQLMPLLNTYATSDQASGALRTHLGTYFQRAGIDPASVH